VCTRTDLLELIRWEEDVFTESRSLDVCIAAIRKKLDKRIIQTIINTGYKLAKPTSK
jgi:DNA-binding response OmpR family regulator